MNGIRREIHPNIGLIPSKNQVRREEKTIVNELVRKRSHEEQEDPHEPKTKPSPTHEINHRIHITMDDNQTPTTSTNPIGQSLTKIT